MVKKLIVITALAATVAAVAIGGKYVINASDMTGQYDGVTVNTENSNAEETVGYIEISSAVEGYECTKADVDSFFAEIEPEFSDIIERVWVNGWQGESGVQGSTVDDEIIYRTIGNRAKDAYITNTFEDILDMWKNGEKVVIIGQNLVTDETTYVIGGEEFRIVGIYGEGPMDDHMAIPLGAYPNLDTINVFCIHFSEQLSETQMDLLNQAVEKVFDGKFSIK